VMPVTEGNEEPVHVGTGTYTAILRPRGALLSSWRLDQFTDASERPADLVADSSEGMFQLRLELPDRTVDFSRIDFRAATEEGPDGRVVTLNARGEDGLDIRLRYGFPKDKYSTNLEVSIDGIPPDVREGSVRLSFPAGIAYVERDPRIDERGAAGVALLGRQYVKHSLGRGHGGWVQQDDGVLEWAGTRSKYFLLAAIPQGAPDGKVTMSRPAGTEKVATSLSLPINLTGPTDYSFQVFAGPMRYPVLESYGVGLEKAIDLGWRLLLPFTRLLLKFFRAVHTFLPNYGVVILVLSVLTKVLFYPLTKKSISAKYKDDAQRRNAAMLDLYKKHKVNPVGGCLPVLIQMPVFIALYSVLNSAIELRKAPFVGWIQDLSAPDRVGSVFGFPIHILPLVMAGTMVWQQKLTPTDPRQASLAYMMPIVMTIFFYTMPSGLVFYWTVNNIMSVGQQIWMNRTMKHQLVAVG
jgi:YidC/Oxa1 family membrane protein insertase